MSLTSTAVAGVLFYALRVLLYNRLSVESYAHFYGAMAFVLLLHPILSIGFDPGMAPFITRFREQNDHSAMKRLILSITIVYAAVATATFAAVTLASPLLSQWLLGTAQATPILAVLGAYVLAVICFKIGITILLGLQMIAVKNIAEAARVILCVAIAYVFVQQPHHAPQAAAAYVVGTFAAAAFAVAAVAIAKANILNAPGVFDTNTLKEVFRSGKFASIAFGGLLVFSNIDTVMLGALRNNNEEAVAAYQIAAPTLMIAFSVLIALGNNFMPMVTTMAYRNEHQRLAAGITRIYETAFVAILPGAALMAVYSDIVIKALFQRDVLDAPAAFNILVIGLVFIFIAYINLHALVGLGRARAAAWAIGIALVANIILNVLLIMRFNLQGAAAATALSNAVAAALSAAALRQHLNLHIPIRALAAAALAAIALIAAGLSTRPWVLNAPYPLLNAALTAAAAYLATLLLLEAAGLCRLRQLARAMIEKSQNLQ